MDFGESTVDAFDRATRRVNKLRASGRSIANAPYRGTLRPDIADGLRFVTIDRAVFWFELNDDDLCVHILAVFLSGQDHITRMRGRLLRHSGLTS
ncbi:MAG: type II toxin-antitoxin system RelE/ParE family toxin [Alphaproteobacteria bacterium]|nr:type II toxin-antitoxin system RelE/ParE family toxin [Alphaproteobacteria bacterium]